MSNPNLSSQFPGEMRTGLHARKSYQYFLPGDIFFIKDLTLNFMSQKQLEEATLVLGQFSSLAADIPDIDFFIYSYLGKEAVQSTVIEGTQTQIDDAFQEDEEEIDLERRDDWQELHHYITALKEAIDNLHKLPLCSRLICETHKTLMSQSRGSTKSPGIYRDSQNWIGGHGPSDAHFVPPAHEHVGAAMQNLENFIHDNTLPIPDLIKIALIHYQFETIHPFLDGNGRIGRMLIPLYLLEKKILSKPILYISDFFEKNRRSYYDALDGARRNEQGLIDWISFFLDGVKTTAIEGMKTTRTITALRTEICTNKIPSLGRRAKNGQKIMDLLFHNPFIHSEKVSQELHISLQSSLKLINAFVDLGILKEITGKKRNRVYAFEDYLVILRK